MVVVKNFRRQIKKKSYKSVKNIFWDMGHFLYILGTNTSIIAAFSHEQMVLLTQYIARTNNTTADGTEGN